MVPHENPVHIFQDSAEDLNQSKCKDSRVLITVSDKTPQGRISPDTRASIVRSRIPHVSRIFVVNSFFCWNCMLKKKSHETSINDPFSGENLHLLFPKFLGVLFSL
jgi:hypothetical protein